MGVVRAMVVHGGPSECRPQVARMPGPQPEAAGRVAAGEARS
ncbi:hypothetical protein [Amycolatopsis thermoflava]|nr:hypothetical protein [Amycolatopsis thermoflava]